MTEISTRMVEFPTNGEETRGYLAKLADNRHHPGLIIIQEWWGLVPHIQEVAERFAREGYITMAPDLYHGVTAGEPDDARKLAMEMDRDRAVTEIVAGIKYLQSLDDVSPKKIGLVGWCMGGSLVFSTAAHLGETGKSPQLGAAVAYYGIPRDLNIVRRIQAPILGLYGENDHGIPLDSVHALQQELEQHGVIHEVHVYPDAGHAFFNDTRPEVYHPKAAQDAWERTLAWLQKHLS